MAMKITAQMIKNLPYQSQLKFYQKEKDELFLELHRLTPAEIDRRHKELANKWCI